MRAGALFVKPLIGWTLCAKLPGNGKDRWSTFKEVADSAGAISVGALAMLFGDPSGGTVAASGIAGLSALGLALRNSSAKRICVAAQKRVLDDLKSVSDFAGVNLERADFLLTSAPSQMTLSPGDLSDAVKAATDTSVEQELARKIHACIPFEPDDQRIETMLNHAILAGVRACYGDADFKASMNSALLIQTVQDNDLQIILLHEIRQEVRDVPQQVVDLLIAQGLVPKPTDSQASVSLADPQQLAAKFEETGLADAQSLITFLTSKAEEYQSFRVQISALDDRVAAIANLKGAAEDAAALLRGRVQEAYTILSAVADSFASVDPVEPVGRRLHYDRLLYAHGLRYGGPSMALAEQIIRDALARIDPDQSPDLWAQAQNNLANALQEQGIRTDGAAGTEFLARAVSAYDAALSIRTKADHPVQWAETKGNLAIAELACADHPASGDPHSHLVAALQHVQAAPTVFDPEHMPYNHDKATTLRDKIKTRLDGGTPDPGQAGRR